jgi:hypothetical protein
MEQRADALDIAVLMNDCLCFEYSEIFFLSIPICMEANDIISSIISNGFCLGK